MAALYLSSFLHSCFKCKDMARQPQPSKWSELPEDLIVMIGERLSHYADYVRFQSVCVSWYSAFSKIPQSPSGHHHQFFPFLLLQPYVKHNSTSVLLSLTEKSKIYHLCDFPVKESKSLYCVGSSHGWLVMAEDKATSTSMYLIKSFTRVQLPLPPMSKLHRPEKVVLSSSPASSSSSLMSSSSSSSQFQSSDDIVAVAIYWDTTKNTEAMAFSRPGDEAWKPLNLHRGGKDVFFDVLFYGDHLYALRLKTLSRYDLLVFHMDMDMDIGGGRPVPNLVDTQQVPGLSCRRNISLVESCGDLLVVERQGRVPIGPPWKPNGFRILKLCKGIRNSDDDDKISRSSKWVEINNLGDRILFLGLNSSFSLSSHDFPGCVGNTIYFTDTKFYSSAFFVREGGGYLMNGYLMNSFGMGVLNLEDERIKPLPLKDCKSRRERRLLGIHGGPSVWLTPTL